MRLSEKKRVKTPKTVPKSDASGVLGGTEIKIA